MTPQGPGRGEAPVWGGDGTFRSLPYASLDVTKYFKFPATNSSSPPPPPRPDDHVIAIEAMDYNANEPAGQRASDPSGRRST